MSNPSVSGIVAKIGIPLALVVAAVWAINRYVGSELATKIISILLIFVAVLFVVWLIVWILRKSATLLEAARSRRQSAQMEAVSQGVSAQAQSELQGLQENLNRALRVLSESKLARGVRKSEALYTLPWILLLGDSDSGKSEVLRQSGLDFAYSTADSHKSRQGAAIPGCDYWFTQEAVVLDLNGAIGTQEEEFDVFRGFLDQLKRARRERPIDSVVVTVSMREVLDQSPEQVELLASRLRRRFDEMIRRLGIRFPIYVLFTKCDQIDGFLEFFANFRSRDRGQVWGATISREQRKRMGVGEIFGGEFDRLVSALLTYRLQLMAVEKDALRLPKIFAFPSRFATLKKKLEDFLGTLLQPTPYSERPMFRGFYFVSAPGEAGGREEEKPQALFEQKWDPSRRLEPRDDRPAPARSYFLEMLFPRVIFADRPLVKASVGTRLRRRLWLDVTFFATLALCLVLLFGMIYSFDQNRSLIEATRLAALRVTDPAWNGQRFSDLMALQQLRERVGELDRYQTEGPRWTLRWGLYSGEDLAKSSRRVYFRRLRDVFIGPTAQALRQKLYAFSTGSGTPPGYGEFYSYLKAYLMMAQPSHAEPSFLSNTLAPLWKSLVTADAEGIALDQLRFYAQQLSNNDPEFLMTSDDRTVAMARSTLCQYPQIERIFARLRDEGNRKFQPYTLAQATGGKSLEYLISSHDVPGVFTEAGWSTYYKQAVGQASKEAVQDDWVLGSACGPLPSGQTSDADYQRLLLDKYFSEYCDEWQKFLGGISVRPLADLTEARAALDSFSRQDSALSRLLLSAAANTMLRKEPEKGGGIGSLVSSALTAFGLSTRPPRADLVDPVADQFQPLHDLVTSPDGGKSPSLAMQYIAALGKVQVRMESLFGAGMQWDQVKAYIDSIANNLGSNEFQETQRLTSIIGRQCSTRSTQPVGPLLEQPLRQAWAAMLRDAGSYLDGLWRTQISDSFKRDLESGFPFNQSGRDLPLASLAQFLRPKDGSLDAFYEKELRMFLSQQGERYAPRPLLGNSQVAFSSSFLEFMGRMNAVRYALFPPGMPDVVVSFDLTPDSTPGVTESLLQIDGQQLRYRNEAQAPVAVSWPSKSGAPQARLTISLQGTGERPATPPIEGEWALFRLLAQARIVAQSQTTYTVTWSLSGSDGTRRDVRYRLQARSIRNPFAADFFRGIVCPERVTQQPALMTGYSQPR